MVVWQVGRINAGTPGLGPVGSSEIVNAAIAMSWEIFSSVAEIDAVEIFSKYNHGPLGDAASIDVLIRHLKVAIQRGAHAPHFFLFFGNPCNGDAGKAFDRS